MPGIPFPIEEKKKDEISKFYQEFMNQKQVTPEMYNSLDDFEKSPIYQNMPDNEKEQLEKYKGKNVIVLVFESKEQAQEFIEQLQQKKLISPSEAGKLITRLEEQQAEQSYQSAPRM